MRYIVIFCCGAWREADLIYFLEPNERFKVRRLEILKSCCGKNENCGAYVAEFKQVERNSNLIKVYRVKNAKAKKFVEKMLKNNKHEQFKYEVGSKSNMNWIWGENCERKNRQGKVVEIVQKAVDFNDKKKVSNISIFLLIIFLHNKLQSLLCSFSYSRRILGL